MAMNTNAIQQISIHASAKEATGISEISICDHYEISIHASAKEATRKEKGKYLINNFNPRLREGGD